MWNIDFKHFDFHSLSRGRGRCGRDGGGGGVSRYFGFLPSVMGSWLQPISKLHINVVSSQV